MNRINCRRKKLWGFEMPQVELVASLQDRSQFYVRMVTKMGISALSRHKGVMSLAVNPWLDLPWVMAVSLEFYAFLVCLSRCYLALMVHTLSRSILS